jgi:hypothetical protein
MTEEHAIQNAIRVALSEYCTLFRINVGKGYTPDGRYFDTGVPAGFSDLFGVRKTDGKAVFIEVKTRQGRPSKNQIHFLDMVRQSGAIAGICRSPEDAIKLITEG